MTRVIKLGGRVQQDPSLAATIAQLWDQGSHPVVIMHGGGDAVTALQEAYGVEARFEGGRRVTSAQDVDFVRMALSGLANKQLVSALVANGVHAVGISGEDDGLIGATLLDADRLGHVGEVTTVRPSIVHALLAARFLPVISPVSRNLSATLGAALNVNGDDAAAVLAIALDATELLLVADVAGVIVDGETVSSLDAASARDLIARNIAVKGMAAKLEAALTAVHGGVSRVRIGDLSMLSNDAAGTTVGTGTATHSNTSRPARDLRVATPALATAGVVQ